MAYYHTPAFTSDWLNIPTSDGSLINFTGSFSEWDVFRQVGGCITHGSDVAIIKEMMDAAEEENNKELDRKIRIIGEAIYALNNVSEFKSAEWFGRDDSWTLTLPGSASEDEWPLHRDWAHFMLWPLDGEIPEALDQAEEDADYEKWINSKQYVKSLEAYNYHKLLSFEKGQSPHWVGECTEDKATTTRASFPVLVLYNTYLKDRFKVDAVIRTEFPNQWGSKGYAKASSPFGDIYIPNKFRGYIGQPGSPQQMTVALQDAGGAGRKANGFRWTCIYTH